MAVHSYLMLIITFLLTLAAAAEDKYPSHDPQSSPATTFYDILESNGLPIGLFPKGIFDFSIDPSSGRFELHLLSPSPCDTEFETRVRYEWNITGTVNYGKIANLSGVAAQELFLWLPVNGIRVDLPSSGLIYFDVGVVFKQFSLSFFETPKDCNALAKGDEGENDLVFFDGRGRIVENQAGKLVRERVTNEEQRAIS